MASSVRREPRTVSARFETRREVRGSSGSAGRLGVSRRAFPRNARSHRASRSVREAAKGGSRETRDAPGEASVASVDVSVLGRSVTRAWRDDSVIFARLRPSAPQMVESWLAARLRGEERRASAPGVCRVCPLDRRRRARRGARRRATRRDGRTCAPARRGVCGREARADEGEGARERLREEEAQTSRNASILGTDDDSGKLTSRIGATITTLFVLCRKHFSTSKLRRSRSVCFQSQENRSRKISRPPS